MRPGVNTEIDILGCFGRQNECMFGAFFSSRTAEWSVSFTRGLVIGNQEVILFHICGVNMNLSLEKLVVVGLMVDPDNAIVDARP